MKTLVLIPARGGSKGVLRKNVKLLAGKPLIAYSIEAALKSKRVDTILVSTDDDEIAHVAKSYGVSVLRRDESLSDDHAPMWLVVQHALNYMKSKHTSFDFLSLLQPTCPFRTVDDIDGSLDLLNQKKVDGIFSVYQVFHEHPARMYTMDEGRLLPYETSVHASLNRQELSAVYQRSGVIYALKISAVLEQETLLVHDVLPYFIPKERSINIDEPLDWIIAEAFLKQKICTEF